jgi:hypothetical protein
MDPTTMDRPVQQGGATASPEVSSVQTPSPASPHVPAHPASAPVSPAPVLLSRAELFSKRHPPAVNVTVEGYGTTRIAGLTQAQWEDLTARYTKEDGTTDTGRGYMAEAVAAALIAPDDDYMFTDPVEGAKQVRTLGIATVSQMFHAVVAQSALSTEARERLGKDSGPTPSDAG